MMWENITVKEECDVDWSAANLKGSALADPWVQKRMQEPLQSGVVHCVFRPPTSYPARIYVFMHADLWLQRNRKVSGCEGRPPFIVRRMNKEERIYHHFDRRLSAYQYESWPRFFEAECREAEVLERESVGSGIGYIKKLRDLEQIYAHLLKGASNISPKSTSLQLKLF